jgi:ketosteroid isomerase-like protein
MISGNANSESVMGREPQTAMHEEIVVPCENSRSLNAPGSILQSALAALSEGRIFEVVAQFNDRFQFNDHALTLEFTERTRLTQFLEKSRELFPDTTLEVVSVMESGDHAIAQWRLTATQTVPFLGSTRYRFPISVFGSTIIRVKSGRIVEWSDYYDQNSSRRMNLAAFFTEWIEY